MLLSLGDPSVTKQYKVAASNDLVIVVAVQLAHPPRHIGTYMLCDMLLYVYLPASALLVGCDICCCIAKQYHHP